MSQRIHEIEVYEALLALQKNYKELYKDLEIQYQTCKCFSCKIQLMTFAMELVSLNSCIADLEEKLIPPLPEVLNQLSIGYETTEDGATSLLL